MAQNPSKKLILFSSNPEVIRFMSIFIVPGTDWTLDTLMLPQPGEITALVTRKAPAVVFFSLDEDPGKVLILISILMLSRPTPIVLICRDPLNCKSIVMKSLHIGAVDILELPDDEMNGLETYIYNSRVMIESASLVRVRRIPASNIIDSLEARSIAEDIIKTHGIEPSKKEPKFLKRQSIECVGIAISTGGPQTLGLFAPTLPEDFPAPVLVVQHIIKGFISTLAERLDKNSRIRVKLAEDSEILLPGTMYLAPDGYHLKVRNGVSGKPEAVLDTEPVKSLFRPSADSLFCSMASVYGGNCAAVMMTGMGSDGVEGLKKLKAEGARTIAQDRESSVIFGMANVAIGKKLIDAVVNLPDLASYLVRLSKG